MADFYSATINLFDRFRGRLLLRELHLAQGQSIGQACRTLGVSEQSYYRWRKEYGGLRTDQAKRLKDLEKENGRLRKAISDLTSVANLRSYPPQHFKSRPGDVPTFVGQASLVDDAMLPS